jgi:leader peptidase (prepilin peptidase) / N-methyltransferase
VPTCQPTADQEIRVTAPWIIAAAVVGVAAGLPIRAVVCYRSTPPGEPPRRGCPACAADIWADRHWLRSLLLASGRCPSCRARIGPPPLAVELLTALVLAVLAARAASPWELAALAWLAVLAIPLAFIDAAVHRLPDQLTIPALLGTFALLTVASLTSHHPGELGRAAAGGAALACFYLALFVIRPTGMGLGDAKLAASVGTALSWVGWQALFGGTFASFALAAIYGVALLALRRATRSSRIPFGPFIAAGALAAIIIW